MTPPPPDNPAASSHPAQEPVAATSAAMNLPQAGTSEVKHRVATYPRQTRAYPLLLLASTATAALFCFMYITKPVIPPAPTLSPNPLAAPTTTTTPLAAPEKPGTTQPPAGPANTTSAQPPAAAATAAPPAPSMLPDTERLPGDTGANLAAKPPAPADPRQTLPAPAPFEETNLHIQHVLTAAAPGGDLSRIVLNVPVLYQSRNLGWTQREVAESRALLQRLTTYQENSRALREEATQLLTAWNHLVERSIPTSVLRADSPSLPANQDYAGRSQAPAGLDTAEAIQIQPAAKP